VTRKVGSEFYAIGEVRKASGLKGEMVVEPLTDLLDRFSRLKSVWLEMNGAHPSRFRVEKITWDGRLVKLKVESIEKREDVHPLVGTLIYVDEENVVEPKEGTYFIHDVIGSTVVDEEGKRIGEVAEVWKLPANDVYVTRGRDREYLIPAVKSVIRTVDIKQKRIEIQTMEGLLE
jgi:16S rRNA processing protein RimM